ncbi:hypothetical protein DL89DRAFT_254525 [Linderina pennispora]|uniref:Alpha-ketoglutarate-dependent dioxygenase AlkB-like domain-containing protein n=1 Tax=Linderina pennispora TaxID=61395 RepID=A0A1Y1WN53_9FUNG|nr:uncharacterized protein DL89DRAFT_254525 [Linderina pennispora]ORX74738.1 hypothetical protein DL89DRAFT_254525 [Linderina pennispora]
MLSRISRARPSSPSLQRLVRSFSEDCSSGSSRLIKPTIGEIPRYTEPIGLVSPETAAPFLRFSDKYLSKGFDPNDMYLHPGFITDAEHTLLVKNCEKKLRRLASSYEMGHFDKRIHNYRECSSAGWSTVGKYDGQIRSILDRVWDLFPASLAWLPPHILDLHQDGEILPHVDNPDYSGFVVGGLCLLGPAVSTFKHVDDPEVRVDVLLNPNSLYFMTNHIRYQFTHEITVDPAQRSWGGKAVPQSRRISLMFRDAKEPSGGWQSMAQNVAGRA